MKSRESITDRFTNRFQEAACRIRRLKILFMRRAIFSRTSLTCGLAWLVYRHTNLNSDLFNFGNLFALSYKEVKSLA